MKFEHHGLGCDLGRSTVLFNLILIYAIQGLLTEKTFLYSWKSYLFLPMVVKRGGLHMYSRTVQFLMEFRHVFAF